MNARTRCFGWSETKKDDRVLRADAGVVSSTEASYRFILEPAHEYPREVLCQMLGVSRSGYHAWVGRAESSRQISDSELVTLIRELFIEYKRRFGAPRITTALREQKKLRVNHKRVARLMREHGLVARRAPRRRINTTDSSKTVSSCPNLLAQDFTATKANQKWVADITYIWTREGWLYLAIVVDLFSRCIVGWSTSESLDRQIVLRAHQMAIDLRQPDPGMVSHRDRGSQYNSDDYRRLLSGRGIQQSMSDRGNCYDNAVGESCFATIKREMLDEEIFDSRQQARSTIFEYIEVYYNRKRLHSTIRYKTPVAFENASLDYPQLTVH